MTCELQESVLRLGTSAASAEETVSLRAHAESCATCNRSLRSLETARETLQGWEPAPTPQARVRVRAGLDAALGSPGRHPVSPWVWGLTGVAAAAAVLAFVLWQPDRPATLDSGTILAAHEALAPGDPVPLGVELRAERRAELSLQEASISLHRDAVVRVEESKDRVEVHVTSGTLEIRTDGRAKARRAGGYYIYIASSHMVLGPGRVSVVVESLDEAAATIRVTEGSVRLAEEGESEGRVVHAGETARIGRAEAADPDVTAVVATKEERPEPAHTATEPLPSPPTAPEIEAPPRPDKLAKSTARSTLKEAKAKLPSAPKEAAVLATRVLDTGASGLIEVEALAILADARRRAGDGTRAMATYERVVAHPDGGPFAEEALLRIALISQRMGNRAAALDALDRAARVAPSGPLSPERTALRARLLLDSGRPDLAATVLDKESARTLELFETRVRVAEELLARSPDRAATLAKMTLAPEMPADLRVRAEAVVAAAKTRATTGGKK